MRDPKKAAALILGVGKAEPDEGAKPDEMQMAAQDVLDAIKTGDAGALASALRGAFAVADSQPHVEGEHEEG